MDHYAVRFALLLLFIGFVSISNVISYSESDFEHCKNTVKEWRSSSIFSDVKEDKHILKDLLFFLHVPRTGGRTYFYCFLKKLYPNSLECPRSYDKLRFDPRKPKCRLLSSHDDYSIISKFPREKTSVVTILRDPIDRVFSTYEFSIEVAARFLVHPNLTSATRMSNRIRPKTSGIISTLDIWPWKYLVPWMREDLFARRDVRRISGLTNKSNDPYDMEEIVMPLHEFINDPIALDIVHNGATFQVAGLTNNSNIGEAHEVRHCVLKYKTLGKYVLEVAKKRLDNMLYVGLTEEHRESATIFANVVGAQVISQLVASSLGNVLAAKNKSEQGSSFLGLMPDTSHQSNNTYTKSMNFSPTEKPETTNEIMTAGKLMEGYETCISNLRKSQATRRNASLKRISPANFTKEARSQVLGVVLEEIKSLNSLDVELYKYAQDIFAKQHKVREQKLVASVNLQQRWQSMLNNTLSWKTLSLLFASTFLLIFFLHLLVNARRRRSKLKI